MNGSGTVKINFKKLKYIKHKTLKLVAVLLLFLMPSLVLGKQFKTLPLLLNVPEVHIATGIKTLFYSTSYYIK